MPRPLAVVTGASSGIGRALAARLTEAGYELVVTGREGSRLQGDRTVAADLSQAAGVMAVRTAIEDRPVSLLVNNAGFGVHGDFVETPLDKELELLRVQLDAALTLTKAVLPGMIERGAGTILNVGSVYAFSPVPEQAVYAACKAFLLSWTSALDQELKGTGVRALSFCPGVVRTEFRARAGVADAGRFKGLSAEEAANAAYQAFLDKKSVAVPGGGNKVFALASRLAGGGGAARLVGALNRLRGLKRAR